MKLFSRALFIFTLMFCIPAVLQAQPGTGKVAESIDAGGYVFLRLEEGDMWIATSPFPVTAGDQVWFGEGMEMKNFYSKSLDRTFESIFFIQEVRTSAVQGDTATGNDFTHSSMAPSSLVPAPTPGEIPPLDGGRTIAGLFTDASHLEGQAVSLRARVVKISRNIMGKNWVTLQDGTGSAPDDRLMATSSELVSPGDLVEVKGVLRENVDIGAGYQYKILLEQATFSPNSQTGD